jgi:DNA-binding response OmpR family regulator
MREQNMGERGERAQQSAGGTRVLVVDDDLRVGAALEKGLRLLGHQVLRAADGEAGLAMAASQQPEVIMLDLRMPGIDGHTFLRRLKASGQSAAVVVMSGQGDMDDVIDVLRGGAVDFLRKPWASVDLATAMARAVAARSAGGPPTPLTMPALSDATVLPTPLSGDIAIPPVPAVLAALRARGRASDDEAEVQRVVTLLEQDAGLAAEVLRVSNRAPYTSGTRAISLRAAVTRVGPRQAHNIVETLCRRRMFRARDPELERLLEQIWRHAVAQATAMRAIANAMRPDRAIPPIDPEAAYLIGLVGDIGASALLCALDAGKGTATLESALPAIQASHAEVGATLLARWFADPAPAAAVREHHPPAHGPASIYGRMLVLAADLVGEDVTAPAPHPQPMVDLCLAELDLDLARLTALVAGVDDGTREVIEACG